MNNKKIQKIIDDIFTEKVKIYPVDNPQKIVGNVRYKIGEPYTNLGLIIFNDCGNFDYIDSITSSDFTHKIIHLHPLRYSKPSENDAWRIFGIPGYLKFRCEKCGVEIRATYETEEFKCETCLANLG